MKKLSYFIATALTGFPSISAAHAEPKMSGTIYIADRGSNTTIKPV